MSRIFIFTGKGGVGKSSVAAAHAVKSAETGKNTLLVSTDMAHNLGDIFEKPLGREIENVLPNLDLYEIDPQYVMEHDYQEIMKYIGSIMTDNGSMDLSALGILPGSEELFSLLRIADIYESGKYDRIIVDCAPTGETLSLQIQKKKKFSYQKDKVF